MKENIYNLLPAICSDKIHENDLGNFKDTFVNIVSSSERTNFKHSKEVLTEHILHPFDFEKLKSSFLSLTPFQLQPYTLYRMAASREKNYMLTIFNKDITSDNYNHLKIPDLDSAIEEFSNHHDQFLPFEYTEKPEYSEITVKSANSSLLTVIKNIIETYNQHDLIPVYSELWYIRTRDKRVKSLFISTSRFDSKISISKINSLKDDFERYLHQYIRPMSVFDIVGPSMVGPSSSHTAGANKIGQIARNIIIGKMNAGGDNVKSIAVKLLGSFRDTGPGHKTPSALGGGLYGFATDADGMLDHGDPDFLKKNGITFPECTASFEGYLRGTTDEDDKYSSEHNSNIAEIIVTTEKEKYTITGFSIGGGNVEVRYINSKLSLPINGKEETFLVNNEVVSTAAGKSTPNAVCVASIYPVSENKKKKTSLPFNSFEELSDYIKKSDLSLIDFILDTEMKLQGSEKEAIFRQTASYWKIMESSVEKGIADNQLSLLKLTGADARKLNSYVGKNKLFDNIYGRAAAYAVAVNEINAKSGVIVACPTAGSCGILPGVLKAYMELANPDEKKLFESILVSGFFGMIMFNDVTTAGADYGCQAEIGVGAAMAAAALTYMEDGDIDQIIHSFILAIKNSLGLICDPVAGLVEVPCVKANGTFASAAITASMMALSGVQSYISPDEVVLTMKEVGNKLNRDYKETAGGGLARTRDGKAVDRAFESEVKRFFGE